MALVFDNRHNLQGKPGLHALIAGVSRYRHLPGGGGPPAKEDWKLPQLTATALTAYKIYRWLIDRRDRLPKRLATVRLLLSPSDAEAQKIAEGMAEIRQAPADAGAALQGVASQCTLDNFTNPGRQSVLLLSKVLRPGYTAVQGRLREARLRNFRGDVLLGDYKEEGDWSRDAKPLTQTDDMVELAFSGDSRGQIVQLLQTGEPAVNVVIPAWHGNGCRLVLKKQPDARYTLEVHLEHVEAELLLRYREQGRWQLAAGVTNSPAVSAEALLRKKREQPIAAAVGAYALLRLGELERLHDWSGNLMKWFEWLPDSAAIRGEHLARTGDHKEALRAFCQLRTRGLPYFSEGLSYAVDRLRLYRGIGEKYFDAEDLKECEAALALLEPFCHFTDFGKPLTTFTGLDPGRPDARPVGGKLASHGGLDVTELMRSKRTKQEDTTTTPRPAVGAGS